MAHLNIEIKAVCKQLARIRSILIGQDARYIGTDYQTDTYFEVPKGRLKLRKGTIEHHLIHYSRSDQAGPKKSMVHLYQPHPEGNLKTLLEHALNILIVVDKQREIYFIDNVKFHLDTVKGLGTFVEIEAIDLQGNLGEKILSEQCRHYMELFNIAREDLIRQSYSDLLAQRQ